MDQSRNWNQIAIAEADADNTAIISNHEEVLLRASCNDALSKPLVGQPR
jgi:hypothetical protein